MPKVVHFYREDKLGGEAIGLRRIMNILKLTTYAKEYTLQLVLLGSVITTGYLISENSLKTSKLTNLEGGIQTCFQRVNQTFTAKIINDASSVYLTQNFQALTEECMAEGLVSAEEVLKKFDGATFKKLSNLASSIHWFHEDILNGGSTGAALTNGAKATNSNPSERFEKIESLKDDVYEGTGALKANLNQTADLLKMIFVSLMTLLGVSIAIELFRQTKRRFSNHVRELEAQSELYDYSVLNSARSIDILRSSLENNGLVYCSRLFTKLVDGISFQATSAKDVVRTTPHSAVQVVTATDTPADYRKKMDMMWEDASVARSADGSARVSDMVEETLNLKSDKVAHLNQDATQTTGQLPVINLENSVEKIFDLVSDRIFKHGISIELNMDSALNIYFRAEELEQVLFQVLNNAIQSLENKTDTTNRKLTINGLRLGSSIVLDVINSGTAQAKSVVDNEVTEIDDANIGLTICESFMEEFGGKVQFDVMMNSKGERTGEIVKLVFKGLPNQQSSRLVDVKVGTKKEILDQISI